MEVASGKELIDPRKIFEAVKMREGFKVVDLGCGTSGHYVLPAAELVGKDGRVFAVDILSGALDGTKNKAALANLANIEYIWGDIERPLGVKIANGSVDIAMLINNLFLAKDKMRMGREALRLLKSGGKLVIVDWKPVLAPFGPAPAARVSVEDAKIAMLTVGFRFVSGFLPGPYHYGLVFEKP